MKNAIIKEKSAIASDNAKPKIANVNNSFAAVGLYAAA